MTAFRRSGRVTTSSQPCSAVRRMVPPRSSSSGGALARPAPQPAERHLDRPRPELDVVVEVAELAPVPDLDRPAVPPLVLADPHPLGVVAEGAERRGAGGADPLRAALVAALLLAQAVGERLHQLVEAAHRLDLRLLLGRQMPLDELAQPVVGQVEPERDLGDGQPLEPGEHPAEHPVEAVDLPLVLHEAGAGEEVEGLGVVERQPGVEPGEEVEVLAEADRDLRGAQLGEEPGEHQISPRRSAPMVTISAASVNRMPCTAAYCSLSSRSPPRATARRHPKSAPRAKASGNSIGPHGLSRPIRAAICACSRASAPSASPKP